MELLKSQPNESVNMIYCDILYGTGRNFGDYQDLKPIRSEIESHYLPRLIEMKRVLKQNEGDVVADYYSGSGTTAKVCQELNRKFIGCDINPKAIEITKARLNGGQ